MNWLLETAISVHAPLVAWIGYLVCEQAAKISVKLVKAPHWHSLDLWETCQQGHPGHFSVPTLSSTAATLTPYLLDPFLGHCLNPVLSMFPQVCVLYVLLHVCSVRAHIWSLCFQLSPLNLHQLLVCTFIAEDTFVLPNAPEYSPINSDIFSLII